ncbi:MAG: CCDC90 family protein [Alphaproteobacteria bacterium]|jgi:hypothetical protein|nr:hypothetical protein [Thalassospira sp.]MCE2965266.1 CCDC90 family protein [Alphaproteobacteria bacterium]
MATLTIDTYTSVTRLREAGFEEKQAKAVIDVLQAADLGAVSSKQDIVDLRADLRVDIANIKADLLKWIIPILLAQVGSVVALMKLLG